MQQQPAAPPRDEQAGRRAENSEHRALGEQLLHDPGSCRSNGHANAHLPASGHSPRQEQVRHVRADDEQQQADADHERIEGHGVRLSHARKALRSGRHEDLLVARRLHRIVLRGVVGQHLMDERRKSRLRLVERHTALQSPEGKEKARVAILQHLLMRHDHVLHRDRDPHVGDLSDDFAAIARGRDTDDRESGAIDRDASTDGARIPIEQSRPISVADDHDWRAANPLILAAIECPAGLRRHAEDLEVIARDESSARMLRFTARADAHVESRDAPGRNQPGDQRVPLAQITKQRIRKQIRAWRALRQRADACGVADRDKLLRVSHREVSQNHRIDEREDGRVGADAEGQCQHHDRGKSGIAAQRTKRVTQILTQFFHAIGSFHGTLSILIQGDAEITDGVHVAELAECFLFRRFGIHAGSDELPFAHLEVKRQLVVHLALDRRTTKGDPEDAAHRLRRKRRRRAQRLTDRASVAFPC